MGRKAYVHPNMPKGMRPMRKASGKVYYYFETGGKPRRMIPLGSDYIEAVKKWTALAEETTRELITFKDVADRYTREVIPTKAPRTQRDNLKEMENLLNYFGPAPLEQIEPHHVRGFLTWRSTKRTVIVFDKHLGRDVEKVFGAETRANREKALLSHIWNYARNMGFTSLPNPCTGVRGFEELGRDAYTEDEVFEAMWVIASQPMQDSMDLAYLTGQRPADVLKISETDLGKDSTLTIIQNKRRGKVKLRIALTNADGTPNNLGLVIQRIQTHKKNHKVRTLQLICNEKGEALTYSALDNRFEDLRKKAAAAAEERGDKALADAIREFQFRDLRAKAGTDKTYSTSLDEARRQLGHTNVKMTEHYVRARKGEKVTPTR